MNKHLSIDQSAYDENKLLAQNFGIAFAKTTFEDMLNIDYQGFLFSWFSINESKFYDETFSVFINTNGYIDIFTQHIDGKVDTCSLRGKDSLNVMKNILNHHENDKPNQSSSWEKFREQATTIQIVKLTTSHT